LKTYINKLYSIPDAAKRAGITEDQINKMIDNNVFKTTDLFFFRNTFSVRGKAIPGLKAKWEEWLAKKDKMKKVPVTILRMDKGE